MSNIVIEIYKNQGALLNGHFLLSSGLHSDAYLQSEKVMMNPMVAAEVIAPLAKQLSSSEFTTIVSPAIGGIRFGYELARQMNKRTLFTERVDGVMLFRRGFELTSGERVIIAEDVVTTGKSTKECAKAIEDAGGIVIGIACIIDRSDSEDIFNLPFYALAKVKVNTWGKAECPLCKQGGTAIKPGSRKEI